jgi:hypothetical protein
LREKIKIEGIEGVKSERVKEIIEEIGYWRKANAIHNWFVKNIQEGVDECQESYVNKDSLKKLLEIVNEVLANPKRAEELLPNATGFFFGSQEYDKYYFDDLKDTKSILEKALEESENSGFYYQSSW